MSAYLLYQNAMREQFKRENPGMTFGQLAKYTSHMYKNLTPEEKATWEARAQQDKARYDAEIAAYVPPPGHGASPPQSSNGNYSVTPLIISLHSCFSFADARGVLIEDQRPRKRSKRGPKDPAAPKRASGAYVFFTNEMRPKVLQEFPGIKFVELGKVLGERWRALSAEAKKRYEDMAADDKLRFQMEMQQYTANQAAIAPPAPVEHAYYHDPNTGISYDAYGAHDVTSHHDPYAHHHHHYHA